MNRHIARVLSIISLSIAAIVHASDDGSSAAEFVVPQPVQAAMGTYCIGCHGEKKSKGQARLDTLSKLDLKLRLDLLNKLQEQLYFKEMPPEESEQPKPAEHKLLTEWVRSELIKANAPLIEDKLNYPDYGNNVDHKKLFSGEIKDKPFSPARRWLVSPQIFKGRIIDIFKTKTDIYEKYMHWPGSTSFYGVSHPFVLPDRSGIRDYAITPLDGGHLLIMLSNAEWMSNKQIRGARVKKGDFKADFFENTSDRFSPITPPAFEAIILNTAKPSDDAIKAAIQAQFKVVLQRPANDTEQAKYLELTRAAIDLGGNTEGLRQMLVAVLLESELLYRIEFGEGAADADGRKMLSPREASYAISYAIGDWSPDPALIKAATEGRLKTKEDYKREVLRLLADDTYYIGQIDPTVNDSDLSTHPKIIRFFREFFGYPNALKVFKDKNRSDGYYDNPGRGNSGTGGILIREADMLVEWCVKQDRDVFANLLGTEKFFAAPLEEDERNRHKKVKHITAADKIDALNTIYDLLKDTDWKNNPKKVADENKEAIDLYRKYFVWNGGGDKSLQQLITHVAAFRAKGLSPNPVWNYPFGIHKLTPWLHSYNINPPDWEYAQQQPFKLENRKGILTHPAWLIAHSSNFHTDPIRRGRWIQEKLLAGRVPDVPITVDAKIPEDPHMTLRERVESVTGPAQEMCWKCHQHMNPLGYPFEKFDDFGRFRADEPLENPENLISKAKGKYDADNYKTKPVSTVGELHGTGNPKLDGSVKDAFDLIDRLGKSDRVRQSIIRHAFRFYMGRNELLSDSQTLIEADKAYIESGGSFKAVIVSLLTSDSFMYRK
ncbi:MAG: DUF1588 domain-containing protein [Planctomycetota bacterium]